MSKCSTLPVCINLAASEERGWHENAGKKTSGVVVVCRRKKVSHCGKEGGKEHIILDGGSVGGREAVVGGQNCAERG